MSSQWSTSPPVGMRCIVHGKVQGVAFRAYARERAEALSINGHAVNREDGTVEVLAHGPAAAVATFRAWLAVGSPLAEVSHVKCESLAQAPPEGFHIG